MIAFLPVCPGAMCDWPAHPMAVASPWIWREAACSLGLLWEAFMGFISSCWLARCSLPLWKQSTLKTHTTRIRSKIIIQSQHKEADWVPLATTEGEKRILFFFFFLSAPLVFGHTPVDSCGSVLYERTWRTQLHKICCHPNFRVRCLFIFQLACNCILSSQLLFCSPVANSHHKSRSAGLGIKSFWSHATWNKTCFRREGLDALCKDLHLPGFVSQKKQHD